MRALAAALVAAGLAACGGGGGGSGPPQAGTASQAATTKTLTVASAYTGVTYPITVYTPAGYAGTADAKPVIYSMDHELEYDTVRNVVETYGLDAIIVSIGNVSGDRRFVDFDLPGVEAYYKFLTLELIPFVEAQYRVDHSRRTLVGYSLSGLAAFITLFEENPSTRYFSGYVITDPSFQLHTSELYAFEQRLWDRTHSLPATVRHCSTSTEGAFSDLANVIIARGYTGLKYSYQAYTFTHAAVLAPCVDTGLRYVFGRG